MFAFTLVLRGFRQRSSRAGRTLLELIGALAIVAAVMALIFVTVGKVLHTARESFEGVDPIALEMAGIEGKPLQVESPLPVPGPQGEIRDQYIVLFDASVPDAQAEAERLVSAFPGGRVIQSFGSPEYQGANVFIPAIDLARLRAAPGVTYVEQDAYCSLCVDSTPTGVARQKAVNNAPGPPKFDPAPLALPIVNGMVLPPNPTDRIAVGVIDTGVDPTHRDLNVNTTMSKAFGPFAPDFKDGNGHGTHVAGIIGAKADGQGIVGVYPGVEIWSLRVMDASGSGTFGNVASALNYVLSNKARISACNMSLAGGRSTLINNLVDSCANAGVAMVVAAGNSAADAAPTSPASASLAVCVAALADSDGKYGAKGVSTRVGADDTFATFSSFGTVVDVIAPGVNIVSTYPGNRYASMSGTSMAAPHVAGLMAMYRNSMVSNGFTSRRATGLELASLIVRNRGAELIPGRFDSRKYPLLIAQ